jgi:hypothetical protein
MLSPLINWLRHSVLSKLLDKFNRVSIIRLLSFIIIIDRYNSIIMAQKLRMEKMEKIQKIVGT